MELFTEISNWHLFECFVVGAFVWIGIQLGRIERHLAVLHEVGVRQRIKEIEDGWERGGQD